MPKKLLGITSVDFGATGQLLIIYSAFAILLRKNGNFIKQCNGYLQSSRKLMILIEFGTPMKLVRLINVSELNLQQSPGRQTFV